MRRRRGAQWVGALELCWQVDPKRRPFGNQQISRLVAARISMEPVEKCPQSHTHQAFSFWTGVAGG
jgi:hypothetical protein